jgi:hypothetical protein
MNIVMALQVLAEKYLLQLEYLFSAGHCIYFCSSSSWLGFANEDFTKGVNVLGTRMLMANKADSRPADTATDFVITS